MEYLSFQLLFITFICPGIFKVKLLLGSVTRWSWRTIIQVFYCSLLTPANIQRLFIRTAHPLGALVSGIVNEGLMERIHLSHTNRNLKKAFVWQRFNREEERVSCPTPLRVSVNNLKIKKLKSERRCIRSDIVYTLALQYTLSLVAWKTVEK